MPKKKNIDMSEYSKKFGKPDIERLGLFIEMPYFEGRPGKRVSGGEVGRRMLAGGHKIKAGTGDCYFDPEFKRIFAGDRGNRKDKYASKLVSRGPFIPPQHQKKHACPGDYFGSFSGTIACFSGKTRPEKGVRETKPNPVTSPAKKGGPGYADICFNKYPEYKPPRYKPWKTPPPSDKPPMCPFTYPRPYFHHNPYVDPKHDPPSKTYYKIPVDKPGKLEGKPDFIPVGPTKWLGGCMAGCFSKWPEWRSEQSFKKKKEIKIPFTLRPLPFTPQSRADKTLQIYPTLYKTGFSCNETNWKTYEPTYIKHLVKPIF